MAAIAYQGVQGHDVEGGSRCLEPGPCCAPVGRIPLVPQAPSPPHTYGTSPPPIPLLQLRYVLRLDGNPRVQQAASKQLPQLDLSKTEGLGNVEESIISKYGAAGAAADAGSEGDEEEEDEDW